MRIRQRLAAWKAGCDSFVEKKGFFVIIGVCVAVIAGSAMLSGHTTLTATVPTPPVGDAQAAARQLQQSLADAVQASPAPTAAPLRRGAPLEETVVLRPFTGERMVLSEVTGIWAVHDAADLAADYGAIVRAIGDGSVVECGEKGVDGAFVTVAHEGGLTACYACLCRTAGLRPGDPVACGQILGFVGRDKLDEQALDPHLCLRVTRDGEAIDPVSLWTP